MKRISLALTPYLVLLFVGGGDFNNLTALPCKVTVEQGLKYRKVSWYKVQEGTEGLTGLVLKNLRTNETALYRSAQHAYQVGDDFSLLLPNSALNDCGKYHCTLWPPVGHHIQEGDYSFYHGGCPEPAESPMMGFLPSSVPASSQWKTMVSVMMAVVLTTTVLIAIFVLIMHSSKQRNMMFYKSLQM